MTDKGKDDDEEVSDGVQKKKTSTTDMQSKIWDDIKQNIKNHESIAMAVGVEDDISAVRYHQQQMIYQQHMANKTAILL